VEPQATRVVRRTGLDVGPAVARYRRIGQRLPVHPRGDGHQTAATDGRLSVARLWSYTFQQAGVFGVCLDIGAKHAGSMVGLMNMSASVGGLVSSVAYGYIVDHFGNYDAPFVPMAILLGVGVLLWFKIDASKELSAEPIVTFMPVPVG
jgi:hypothetical protein